MSSNIADEFEESDAGLIALTGVLEALRLPYTGTDPGGLALQGDKALAKHLFAFNGIPSPASMVVGRGSLPVPADHLPFPLIVKARWGVGSYGIDAGVVVADEDALRVRVRHLHEAVGDDALIERDIEGREFTVGVLGNDSPQSFHPVEIAFRELPPGVPRVYTNAAKWDRGSPEFWGIEGIPADVPGELLERLQAVALAACRAVRVRDYATVDLRLDASGNLYVLEVNGNCFLRPSSEFARGAAASGIDYNALINRIADLAWTRCRPA